MDVIEYLNIPEKGKTNVKIAVKQICENLSADAKTKRVIEKSVASFYVKGVLNADVTGMWGVDNDDYLYAEILICRVTLKTDAYLQQVNELLNAVFQNPVIIVYDYDGRYAIGCAAKRKNKAEKDKSVIEKFYLTDTFVVDDLHKRLLSEITYDKRNLKDFYDNVCNICLAEQYVKLTGRIPETIDETIKAKSATIRRLTVQKRELESDYNQADSMQEKMDIHMKIKHIEKQLGDIK